MSLKFLYYKEDNDLLSFNCAVALAKTDKIHCETDDEDSGSEYDCRNMNCTVCEDYV